MYPVATGLGNTTVTQHGAWPLLRAAIGGAALAVFFLALLLATACRGIGFGDRNIACLVGGFAAYPGWGPPVVGGSGAFVLGAPTGVALFLDGERSAVVLPAGSHEWRIEPYPLLGCGSDRRP